MDQRCGRPRRRRIAVATIGQRCRLKREVCLNFSIRHFYEHITERHRIAVSDTSTRMVLGSGVVQKEAGRGRSAPARAPPLRVCWSILTAPWLFRLPQLRSVVVSRQILRSEMPKAIRHSGCRRSKRSRLREQQP